MPPAPDPRSAAFNRGLLLVKAASPLALVGGLTADLTTGLTLGAVALCLAAALVLPRAPRLVTTALLLGGVGLELAVGLGGALGESPLAGLVLGILLIFAVEATATGESGYGGGTREREALFAHGAAYAALAIGLLAAVVGPGSLVDVAELAAAGIVGAAGLRWALARRRRRLLRGLALTATIAVAALASALSGELSLAWVAIPTAALLVIPSHRVDVETPLWKTIAEHPQRLLVGTFAALCGVGGLLLSLPVASAGPPLGAIAAIFTAVSAVCVTGLSVLDTADLSAAGQVILLLLIQLGGLGIMTFSTVIFGLFGQRVSLRHEGAVSDLISGHDRGALGAAARRLLVLTALAEGVGALALTAGFVAAGDTLGAAAWRGLFTAVSAFCNAGFALQSDSLVAYQGAPWILHTIAVLIVLGGIAPLATVLLPGRRRRRASPLRSLQARLIFIVSGVLLVAGAALFAAFEWDGALAGLPLGDRLHNAWFQSVTLRTAGFNSVLLDDVRPATLTMMLLWMIIGGAPGGTAGGVKVTTVAVIGLVVSNAVRGRWGAEAFGRRLSPPTIYKALVITVIAGLGVVIAALCLLLTQPLPTGIAVFEVVSALGTVGLTLGGTAALDNVGKVVIIACMFVGRVGLLTVLMLLQRPGPAPALARPPEDIDIG
ncbi:MAG: potassium transporter TrkG [Nannocystaceae bacterium]